MDEDYLEYLFVTGQLDNDSNDDDSSDDDDEE